VCRPYLLDRRGAVRYCNRTYIPDFVWLGHRRTHSSTKTSSSATTGVRKEPSASTSATTTPASAAHDTTDGHLRWVTYRMVRREAFPKADSTVHHHQHTQQEREEEWSGSPVLSGSHRASWDPRFNLRAKFPPSDVPTNGFRLIIGREQLVYYRNGTDWHLDECGVGLRNVLETCRLVEPLDVPPATATPPCNDSSANTEATMIDRTFTPDDVVGAVPAPSKKMKMAPPPLPGDGDFIYPHSALRMLRYRREADAKSGRVVLGRSNRAAACSSTSRIRYDEVGYEEGATNSWFFVVDGPLHASPVLADEDGPRGRFHPRTSSSSSSSTADGGKKATHTTTEIGRSGPQAPPKVVNVAVEQPGRCTFFEKDKHEENRRRRLFPGPRQEGRPTAADPYPWDQEPPNPQPATVNSGRNSNSSSKVTPSSTRAMSTASSSISVEMFDGLMPQLSGWSFHSVLNKKIGGGGGGGGTEVAESDSEECDQEPECSAHYPPTPPSPMKVNDNEDDADDGVSFSSGSPVADNSSSSSSSSSSSDSDSNLAVHIDWSCEGGRERGSSPPLLTDPTATKQKQQQQQQQMPTDGGNGGPSRRPKRDKQRDKHRSSLGARRRLEY
jgi:hypothetical protein